MPTCLSLVRSITAVPTHLSPLVPRAFRSSTHFPSLPAVLPCSAARVTASVRESLARLQLSYVDLIQCHDIEFAQLDQIVGETLPALAALKAAGFVRHVGITGLPLKIFANVLDRWERWRCVVGVDGDEGGREMGAVRSIGATATTHHRQPAPL